LDITRLLDRWSDGDENALSELLPLVYRELRQLADRYLRRERKDHTLQPTALVHEAYLRLVDVQDAGFHNRTHFYGAAAQVMRRILVDHARGHRAAKRGHGVVPVDLDQALNIGIDLRLDLVALDEALQRLGALRPELTRVVELRYFGGLFIDETADVLDVSPATVKRYWVFARAWLYRELNA
jgi:RNA polymerase sigma factor (TIGR02999 family)